MKKYIAYLFSIAVLAFTAAACNDDPLSQNSVIETPKAYERTPLDAWLEENYLKPYNIDFKYRFEVNESDMNYYTVPARYDLAVKMARLVKYLCVDTYDEICGLEFTRSYFPKMFFLIGEWEYRNNGSFILGTAEGGKKILLSGVNYLDKVLNGESSGVVEAMDPAESLNHYYIKTIHHEFTHILNQQVVFPTDFTAISGPDYVNDLQFEEPYSSTYGSRGFISAYAQTNSSEDFAEMVSIYVTNSAESWAAMLAAAGSEGAAKIEAKLGIVRTYLSESWNINMDMLRAAILRRQGDVMSGRIDLSKLN